MAVATQRKPVFFTQNDIDTIIQAVSRKFSKIYRLPYNVEIKVVPSTIKDDVTETLGATKFEAGSICVLIASPYVIYRELFAKPGKLRPEYIDTDPETVVAKTFAGLLAHELAHIYFFPGNAKSEAVALSSIARALGEYDKTTMPVLALLSNYASDVVNESLLMTHYAMFTDMIGNLSRLELHYMFLKNKMFLNTIKRYYKVDIPLTKDYDTIVGYILARTTFETQLLLLHHYITSATRTTKQVLNPSAAEKKVEYIVSKALSTIPGTGPPPLSNILATAEIYKQIVRLASGTNIGSLSNLIHTHTPSQIILGKKTSIVAEATKILRAVLSPTGTTPSIPQFKTIEELEYTLVLAMYMYQRTLRNAVAIMTRMAPPIPSLVLYPPRIIITQKQHMQSLAGGGEKDSLADVGDPPPAKLDEDTSKKAGEELRRAAETARERLENASENTNTSGSASNTCNTGSQSRPGRGLGTLKKDEGIPVTGRGGGGYADPETYMEVESILTVARSLNLPKLLTSRGRYKTVSRTSKTVLPLHRASRLYPKSLVESNIKSRITGLPKPVFLKGVSRVKGAAEPRRERSSKPPEQITAVIDMSGSTMDVMNIFNNIVSTPLSIYHVEKAVVVSLVLPIRDAPACKVKLIPFSSSVIEEHDIRVSPSAPRKIAEYMPRKHMVFGGTDIVSAVKYAVDKHVDGKKNVLVILTDAEIYSADAKQVVDIISKKIEKSPLLFLVINNRVTTAATTLKRMLENKARNRYVILTSSPGWAKELRNAIVEISKRLTGT